MAPEWLYSLVLLAAIVHAVWNAVLKNAADRLLTMAAMRLVSMVVGLSVLPFVPWPGPDAWIWLACAAVAHFFYYGLLIRTYQTGDMSQVYPIARGTAPVFLAVIAFVAVGERLSVAQALAVALTSAGIFTLALGRGGSSLGVRYAFATGLSITAYTFFGGMGVRTSPGVLGFHAWLEVITGVGFLSFAALRRRGAVFAFARSGALAGAGGGLIGLAGYFVYLVAVKALPLAPVTALRETSVIFGVLIGAIYFNEGFGPRRIFAALLVALGVGTLAYAM